LGTHLARATKFYKLIQNLIASLSNSDSGMTQ
jgi:hypothetical protein